MPPAGAVPPGYGADPTKVDVGEAFGWAWGKFKNNVGVMILPGLGVLVLAILLIVFAISASAIFGSTDAYTGQKTLGAGGVFLLFLVQIVFYLGLLYLQASIT